ncbi:MAG: protein phosphatase 2C domain-containing protein [Actinomycetia bacterium]|nr:protein phosphatase 2C domain-containing protein [Actinomycetes bacterium]
MPDPLPGDDPVLRYQPPGVEWTPAPDTDAELHPPRSCYRCGGEVDQDSYCTVCGAKAQSERDHFREQPADWVGGVCDRGTRHPQNEDAMALAADQAPGSRAVLVVCDGVSSSEDSDVASLAGAQAARDELWEADLPDADPVEAQLAAVTSSLIKAVAAANRAVVERTSPDSVNAASATFAAAVVVGSQAYVANLGDSRVYWLPDAGDPVQLTVDDSVAQDRIESGVSREDAEAGFGAHAITKWLGRDAPDLVPRVATLTLCGDGWLLVCSDGIWNYASTPAEICEVLQTALTAQPGPTCVVDVCESMVAWANEQGGKDNITVALARIGTPAQYQAPEPAAADVPSTPAPEPVTVSSSPSPAVPEEDHSQPGAGPASDAPEARPLVEPEPDPQGGSLPGTTTGFPSATAQPGTLAEPPAWQAQPASEPTWQQPPPPAWQQPPPTTWQSAQAEPHPTWQQPSQAAEPTMERYVPPSPVPPPDSAALYPYPAVPTPADPPPTAPGDRTQLTPFPVQAADAAEEYRHPDTPQPGREAH